MDSPVILEIAGAVKGKRVFTWEDLTAINSQWQIDDVSQVDPARSGGAIWLRGILEFLVSVEGMDCRGFC